MHYIYLHIYIYQLVINTIYYMYRMHIYTMCFYDKIDEK